MPDTICAGSILDGDKSFDSYHSLYPYGQSGSPAFGLRLLDEAERTGDDEGQVAALGWCAHQLADATAHYDGYCEGLPTFGHLCTGESLRERTIQRVLGDIDHGVSELLADVLCMAEADGPELLRRPGIVSFAELVEDTSTELGGFPILGADHWDGLVREFRTLLHMQSFAIRALTKARPDGDDEHTWREIKQHYAGGAGGDGESGNVNGEYLDGALNRAVESVVAFLRDPTAEPDRAEGVEASAEPEWMMPGGPAAGKPSVGGALVYRLAKWALGHPSLARAIPYALGDDVVFGLLRHFWDPGPKMKTLMLRIMLTLADAIIEGETFAEARRKALAAVPPLVDATRCYPVPGSTISYGDSDRIEIVLVDALTDSEQPPIEVQSITLGGHPVVLPQREFAWDPQEEGWAVCVPVPMKLGLTHHQVCIEATGPRRNPVRYEWDFTVA